MANSIVITNESKASPTGEVAFTITNATNNAGKYQCKLRGIGQTKTDQFTLSGGAQVDASQSNKAIRQLDLPAKGTYQVPAKISPQAPAGEHKISLLVWSVADPDGDCAEGQVCTVTQAPPVPPKPFPWAIAGIIAGVVVIGAGVGTWLLVFHDDRPKLVEVPKLVGMSFNEAQQSLQKVSLAAQRGDIVNNGVSEGQVTDQDPKPSAKVAAKSTVKLSVAKHEAPPPPQDPTFVDFPRPMVSGFALDICREWGANCGKPAAGPFCATQGFVAASDFLTTQDSPPTRVIGTGQICKENFCDRISWVRCTKTPAFNKFIALDAVMLARNEQKRKIAGK